MVRQQFIIRVTDSFSAQLIILLSTLLSLQGKMERSNNIIHAYR